MKKLYSTILLMLSVMTVYAITPQISTSRLKFIGSTPLQTPAKHLNSHATLAETDWQTLEGTCTFTDDAFTTLFSAMGLTPLTWNVTIQKHSTKEIYRVADPYKDDPFFVGNHTADPERYLYLNAIDPEKVFFCDETGDPVPYYVTGIDIGGGYGYGRITTAANIYFANGETPADNTYAKLRHGAFEFPTGVIGVGFENLQNGNFAEGNLNGKMRITLPDAKDYSCEVYYNRYAVRDEEIIVNLSIGSDVAVAKFGTFANEPWISLNTVAALMAYQGMEVTAGRQLIDLSGVDRRTTATFVLICYDEQGNIVSHDYTEVIVDGKDNDQWTTLDGMGEYTEGIYSEIYNGFSTQTYDVQVQEHNIYKGYYRILNPYTNGNWYVPAQAGPNYDTELEHYLYIDATNPEQVFIEDSPVGVNFTDGEGMISSIPFVYLCYDQPADGLYGTRDDNGLITFPANSLTFSEKRYVNGARLPISSAATKLQLPASWAAIDAVPTLNTTNESEQYFNLQGIKIAHPTPGQLYIRTTGSKTEKVIF